MQMVMIMPLFLKGEPIVMTATGTFIQVLHRKSRCRTVWKMRMVMDMEPYFPLLELLV